MSDQSARPFKDAIELFRQKIAGARRQTGRLQKDLADALGLNAHVLSHKLHGTDGARLTYPEVKQIIKTLASWEAITTQAEAIDLLVLMGLKQESFTSAEWATPPLNRLEPETRELPPAPATRPRNQGGGPPRRDERAAGAGWLVRTKLSPPVLRPGTVRRARLVDAVHAALTGHRLVLVSAPAGSGKTTLVAEALQSIAGMACAWVSLDPEDDDPARFLALLVAAVDRLDPDASSGARAVLAELPDPSVHPKQVIGALVNGIAAALPDPVALVLDDLHLMKAPAIFEVLDYLIERLPPQFRVVLITRHDPPLALPRLRARGELAEIGSADLRFTPAESERLLSALRLEVTAEQVADMQARTEGWATGLRLYAAALSRRSVPADRALFRAAAAQADRYTFDFLATEVLGREDQETRAFLLETSILQRLTPALCQAVTTCPDATTLLERLERRNLFVVRLDAVEGQGDVFRYHDLFAAFLRQTLAREMPGRVAELHRRAAAVEPVPAAAITHLLAGGLWEEAAGRIGAVGGMLLREGLVQTVRAWIEALPAEVREAHPRLLFLLAVCIGRRGRLAEATVLLERSAEGFSHAGDAAGRGEALAQLASAALMEGEAARALALMEEALDLPLTPESRVQLLLERARTHLWRGEPSRAATDLDAALELGAGPADAVLLATLLTHLHPIFTALPAGVDRVERVCRLVTTRIGDQAGPLQATLHGQWALVHLCRGRFDACLEAGERALALRERYGSANRLLDIWTVSSVAMVHAARAEHTEAQRYIDLMFQQFAELGLGPAQRSAGLYLWGWASWLAGDADTAREAYRQMAEAGSGIPATPILRAMLAGLLSMAEGQYAAAEEHLRRAIALNRGVPPVDLHGNPRLLLAHLYLMTGRPGRAMAEFEPVLEACEAADTPGLILKEGTPMLPLLRVAVERGVAPAFASRLLELAGAARKPRPVQVPETGETLSAREIEVLRLLATGAGNREIAAQLVIGEQTVKTHVAHILQKLDVPSRRQATLRARQLGLI